MAWVASWTDLCRRNASDARPFRQANVLRLLSDHWRQTQRRSLARTNKRVIFRLFFLPSPAERAHRCQTGFEIWSETWLLALKRRFKSHGMTCWSSEGPDWRGCYQARICKLPEVYSSQIVKDCKSNCIRLFLDSTLRIFKPAMYQPRTKKQFDGLVLLSSGVSYHRKTLKRSSLMFENTSRDIPSKASQPMQPIRYVVYGDDNFSCDWQWSRSFTNRTGVPLR